MSLSEENAAPTGTAILEAPASAEGLETGIQAAYPPGDRPDPLTAAREYRERGWVPIPVSRHDNPNPGRRGKAPILKRTEYPTIGGVTETYLDKWWGSAKPQNIGVVLDDGHVVIDLDSKQDGGQSAHDLIAGSETLSSWPRERTSGGFHLHVRCADLPEPILNEAGRQSKVVRKISDSLIAEIFFGGAMTISPSIHPSGHLYHWELDKELPAVSWNDLCGALGVEAAAATKASKSAAGSTGKALFHGDPRRLDIVGLCKELGLYGKPIDSKVGKHSIQCPWRGDHSDAAEPWNPDDTSTCIWEAREGQPPAFKCLHASHDNRKLDDLLVWADKRVPGSVLKHWPNATGGPTEFDPGDRLYVELPGTSRLVSDFAREVGEAFKDRYLWFNRSGQVFTIRKTLERVNGGNSEGQAKANSKWTCWTSIAVVSPHEAVSSVERAIVPYKFENLPGSGGGKSGNGEVVRVPVPKSMSTDTARQLLPSMDLLEELPRLDRVLRAPIPMIEPETSKIFVPVPGYNPATNTYLVHEAPEIHELSIGESKAVLREILRDFCFESEQDVQHAIAALLTPFVRGLYSRWSVRVPVFFFLGNRPRAGKDYLAGCIHIVYEGRTNEDPPLDANIEELRKKITSALINGRSRMHFSNCSGHLDNSVFEQIVTNERWTDRVLGGNKEVTLPNEMEFSLSGNTGVTYNPDLSARARFIKLRFDQEHENLRTFSKPDLHGWVYDNRGKILSAMWGLVQHWDREGRPKGETPFTSFSEWGEVVGGIMACCGLGDPCIPDQSETAAVGDVESLQMKLLYQLCYGEHPDEWITKQTVRNLVEKYNAHDEGEPIFGYMNLNDQGDRVRFGRLLDKYQGRIFEGIRMEFDPTATRPARRRVRFTRPPEGSRTVRPVNLILPGTDVEDAPPMANPDGCPGSSGSLGSVVPPAYAEKESKNTIPTELLPADGQTGVSETSKTTNTTTPGWVLVDTPEGVADVVRAIRESGQPLALDIETTGEKKGDALDPRRGSIRLLSLAIPDKAPWIIDMKAVGGDLGQLPEVLAQSPTIAHNARFDLAFLRHHLGIKASRVKCSLSAAKLLSAGLPKAQVHNDLGSLLRQWLDLDLPKDQGDSDWSGALSPEQLEYAANDVRYLHRLMAILEDELNHAHMDSVWELECALLPVIVEMYESGFAVDREQIERVLKDKEAAFEKQREETSRILGGVNPNSSPKLLEALRADGLNIPDTSRATLSQLDHPKARSVLDFRKAQVSKQQYKKIQEAIQDDSRIHGTFDPLGASTGRLSCRDPNLQSISRGEIREAFIAPEGRKLVCADYSQIDLRVVAAVCGDERMMNSYRNGEDLHTVTASQILEKDPEQVTKEERQQAKAVNFGLIYGQSPEGLVRYARETYGVEMSLEDAQLYHARFFRFYDGIREWHEEARRNATANARSTRTRLGRRRFLPQGSDFWWGRFSQSLNTPIQGGAADVLKSALVKLGELLPDDAHVVSNVHDEIVVECSEDSAHEVKGLLEKAMSDALAENYPEVATKTVAGIGATWHEAKENSELPQEEAGS